MQILIEANGGDGGETECVFVDMTPEKATELLALRDRCSPVFVIEKFQKIAFRDQVSAHLHPTLAYDRLVKNTYSEEDLDKTRMGVYWCDVTLNKDGVWWEGAIKHSSEIFSSSTISWEMIKKFANDDFSALD